MDKKTFINYINKKLIISVQGVEQEPTNDAHFLAVMARAVVASGAEVLRCSQVEHISAIQKEVGPNVPIIGLIKKHFDNSEIYITPTIKEIDQLAALKINAIAIDATFRKRPDNHSVVDLVNYIHTTYPEIAVMADCASLEEVIQADAIGFDIVSTTLRGYTSDTNGESNIADDFAFLKKIAKLNLKSVFIAEGGIWTPEEAKKALAIADAVVVGSAITRPHQIAEKFFREVNK